MWYGFLLVSVIPTDCELLECVVSFNLIECVGGEVPISLIAFPQVVEDTCYLRSASVIEPPLHFEAVNAVGNP